MDDMDGAQENSSCRSRRPCRLLTRITHVGLLLQYHRLVFCALCSVQIIEDIFVGLNRGLLLLGGAVEKLHQDYAHRRSVLQAPSSNIEGVEPSSVPGEQCGIAVTPRNATLRSLAAKQHFWVEANYRVEQSRSNCCFSPQLTKTAFCHPSGSHHTRIRRRRST